MLSVFSTPAVSIFLATITPTISIISINIGLFTKRQMCSSLLFMGILGISFSSLFNFSANALQTNYNNLSYINSNSISLAACLISLVIFVFFSERIFFELLSKKVRIYTLLFMVFFFSFTTWFFSLAIFNTILTGYTCISLYDLIKNFKNGISDAHSPESGTSIEDVNFKHTPNVYILFLESIHSTDALKEIYEIDNTQLLSSLRDDNFKIYDNVYSNGTNTVSAFKNMVWPRTLYDYHREDRSLQITPSEILTTFKNNGYALNFFACQHIRMFFSELFDRIPKDSSSKTELKLNKNFAPILAQSSFLRKQFSVHDVFETRSDFESLLVDMEAVIKENKETPQMHWFHFGARHSDISYSWEELGGFNELYKAAYFRTEKEIIRTIEIIKKNDPNPLIVAVGDHGAHRYNHIECGEGNNPNDIIRSRGFSPSLIAKDKCSVFLGIHWSGIHYSDGHVLSHVTLFNHILASLSEDRTLLDDMMPNISFCNSNQFGRLIIARDGVALDNWEKVNEKEQIPFLLSEIKKDDSNVENHLALVSKYLEFGHKEKGMEYLLSLCKKFPTEEDIHTMAVQEFFKQRRYEEAKKYARNILLFTPNSHKALYYLSVISERIGKPEETDKYIVRALTSTESTVLPDDCYIRYSHALIRNGDIRQLQSAIQSLNRLYVSVEMYVDMHMQYLAFLNGNSTSLFDWIETQIQNMQGWHQILFKTRKLIIYMQTEDWANAEEVAKQLIKEKNMYSGLYATLACSMEKQGKISEALQVLLNGISKTQSNHLVEQVAFITRRNSIHHPDFVPLKVMAQKQMEARIGSWGKLSKFDSSWYEKEYKTRPNGASPLEHYIQNGPTLMLNPNSEFDTTFYYLNSPEIFLRGLDAAVHYYQHGRFELKRPSFICIPDKSIAPDIHWKSSQT
ncbi:sulfatase-like hydrolase/transferase [Maridesulfovibrio sp.]|uniref:sulfatase-like hydrolase/transferase n=1 Tax=Maridesulfovibrio sp. TaxID=2795000 RepID=UPI002A18762D|nr:sulfatase-like hydrolase/transferase [Maridesulfovibrio sp.]